MESCCDSKISELTDLGRSQAKVLRQVLFINLLMFGVEATYGWVANSAALLADSLDMLGDALVYGASLYAIGKGARWNASVSGVKGIVMILFGIGVFLHALLNFWKPGLPDAQTMGVVGAAALLANIVCAFLLFRHRSDDLNMTSSWLCSKNDVLANASVMAAGGLVALSGSKYPDLVVGLAIAALILKSGYFVVRSANAQLRNA